jgi:hypothetical protein
MLWTQMADHPALLQSSAASTDSASWAEAANERHLPRVLALDAHGRILDWISWRQAAHLSPAGKARSTCIPSSPPRATRARPRSLPRRP